MHKDFSFWKYFPLVLLLVIISCTGISQENLPAASATPTMISTSSKTPESQTINDGTQVISTPVSDISIRPTATPLERTFKKGDCDDHIAGHIFFMRANGEGNRNRASRNDLYVMDGNGCFPRFVMPEVSGSPAWSKDGKRLAIGCENNESLCILDVKKTLDTCSDNIHAIGECQAHILQKVALPVAIRDDNEMYNISWSPDGSQIAVEGGSMVTRQYYVYILALSGGANTWRLFLQGLPHFNIAWSPKEDQFAISGLLFINVESANNVVRGYDPEWSPDGRKIAFVRPFSFGEHNREPNGIAIIDFDNDFNGKNWKWLYEPAFRDENYWPPRDLWIGDHQEYRLLSWSPDQQYIAFVAELFGTQSHIFRLDITTGDIVKLTANFILESEFAPQHFYAPAWGP